MIDTPTVALVRDPADQVAASPPARWAAEQLTRALEQRGVRVAAFEHAGSAPPGARCIVLAGANEPVARACLSSANATVPDAAESLALVPGRLAGGESVLLATGRDPRGLVYAILELAERVRTAVGDPLAALRLSGPVIQQPANPIRGVARLFTSDVEDKPWYYDRDFWRRYLSMLATQRFNRIHLAFGIGHDFLRNVIDAYLLFAYPFLVDVPGYDVRVPGLTSSERQQNLDALRFASDEAAARGLHFQLGLWTQAYEWTDSPNANYVIEGLTSDNHAQYCRDAVRAVLEACPVDRRRDLPRPWRKRRAGGQLRLLARGLQRRRRLRPPRRAGPAPQGRRPGDDRRRARDRPTGDALAQVHRRAHGSARSPGRYPRTGTGIRRRVAATRLSRA